jgi:uncharacterized protein DUF4231
MLIEGITIPIKRSVVNRGLLASNGPNRLRFSYRNRQNAVTRQWLSQPPDQSAFGDDPVAACERAITSVRSKADRNERVARMTTTAITVASALIPVCLIASTQGHPLFGASSCPSLLAAIAATAAGIVQFERPHERWKLYRGHQRALEVERFRFQKRIAHYQSTNRSARAVSPTRSRTCRRPYITTGSA